MSLTEQDLRELLAERVIGVRPPVGQLDSVMNGVAATQRRRRVVVGVAMLAAVGAVAIIAPVLSGGAQRGAPGPATSPAPGTSAWVVAPERDLMKRTATAYGLEITTDGPWGIPNYMGRKHGATVTLSVTNVSAQTWRGVLGVGMCSDRNDGPRGIFGSARVPMGVMTPIKDSRPLMPFGSTATGGVLEGLSDSAVRTLDPGQTVVLTYQVYNRFVAGPGVTVRGWVPVLDPFDNVSRTAPPCEDYGVLDFGS